MLTPKQARFVEEYLQDLNATQAAIRAGYSLKTANQQGPRLLENPDVIAAIDAAKLNRSERAKIDALWVLKRLVDEAEADIADLYDRETGELRPVHDWPEIWRKGLVQGIEVEELFEGRGADREHVGRIRKIRLDSRIKRAELIGKHVFVSAFQEVIAHKGLEGLADRLARASQRNIDAVPVAAPSALPVNAAPAVAPAPVEHAPVPKPEPVATELPSAPGSDAIIAAKPEPYRPVLDWPDEQAFADTDYSSFEGGFLKSRS